MFYTIGSSGFGVVSVAAPYEFALWPAFVHNYRTVTFEVVVYLFTRLLWFDIIIFYLVKINPHWSVLVDLRIAHFRRLLRVDVGVFICSMVSDWFKPYSNLVVVTWELFSFLWSSIYESNHSLVLFSLPDFIWTTNFFLVGENVKLLSFSSTFLLKDIWGSIKILCINIIIFGSIYLTWRVLVI